MHDDKRVCSRRKAAWTGGALTLLGVLSSSSPAHAIGPGEVFAVIGWIRQSYAYYKEAKAFLGNEKPGPTVADQLDDLRDAIFGELRTQRNQLWRADAITVARNFSTLAR